MHSNGKFYEEDNEPHEIHFLVRLGDLKGVNAPCENSNILEFNEIKIILLRFTGNQYLYLGVYTDLIIGK